MIGMPELKDDPRFQNPHDSTSGPEFEVYWYLWLADHTKAEVLEACIEARIATAPVDTPEDLLNYRHLQERGYFTEIDHPQTGRIAYPGAPFKMSETPWLVNRPAPLLGQHNEEVYCKQLGYIHEDLTKLRDNGII